MKKFFIIVGVLVVAGAVIGGVLYVTFPVAMTTYGGMGLNFLKSLAAPAGTLTIETNPAYKAPVSCSALTTVGRCGMAQCCSRRLAKLQQDTGLAALLAARPDQREECREPEGPVHLRPRHSSLPLNPA